MIIPARTPPHRIVTRILDAVLDQGLAATDIEVDIPMRVLPEGPDRDTAITVLSAYGVSVTTRSAP